MGGENRRQRHFHRQGAKVAEGSSRSFSNRPLRSSREGRKENHLPNRVNDIENNRTFAMSSFDSPNTSTLRVIKPHYSGVIPSEKANFL